MHHRWIAILACAALLGLPGCSLYFGPDESETPPVADPDDPLPNPARPDPGDPTDPGNPTDPTDPTDPGNSTGWILQDFSTSDDQSQCNGQRLVRFSQDYQVWVGAVLCGSSERYKLYMSETQRGTYHQIADFAGHGQDHCELVNPRFRIPDEDNITSGGCTECAVGSLVDVIDVPVFARSRFGQPFEQVTARFWADLSTLWYECGVALTAGGRPPPSPDRWRPLEFRTHDNTRYCDGPRFVRLSSEYNLWVGAELCSADGSTYKLYMSDDASGTFYEIADYGGHGQDHCELVNPRFRLPNEDDITSGGCSSCAVGELIDVDAIPIYARSSFGEPFERTTATFWGDLTTSWYRCGEPVR